MAAARPRTIRRMDTKITTADAQDMVSHWLETPVNGYLGSDYGSNFPDLLQTPLRTGGADAVIAKLKTDVPLLAAMPRGSVNLYSQDTGPDQRRYFIDLSGQTVDIGGK
ncbi:hypothetical protein LA345_39175 (plasmid) [Burkholderia vietnamiensis]|uniref:Uncharacterized protein n=1 Tax=Burkholderia vietnamiensis (strain G4 / LMG 22486) TaxID=269482 RepID=A4JW83_BURVG|nr:hypothetical protein Bcep1808_7666 [Burkholderia vietnamiensis G4]MCB4349823.1 hypothetical protein [Burkholderia vietnamiensis]